MGLLWASSIDELTRTDRLRSRSQQRDCCVIRKSLGDRQSLVPLSQAKKNHGALQVDRVSHTHSEDAAGETQITNLSGGSHRFQKDGLRDFRRLGDTQ
jgi:hypothetical protein